MSWQDKLRQVEPYVAGEQPKINNMIKLNTNENPYGPCKQIKDILKEIDIEKLKLYPNSDGEELRRKVHYRKSSLCQIHTIKLICFFCSINPATAVYADDHRKLLSRFFLRAVYVQQIPLFIFTIHRPLYERTA